MDRQTDRQIDRQTDEGARRGGQNSALYDIYVTSLSVT